MDLVKKTSPFMMARIVIYGLFGLISLVFLGIMVGIGFLLIKTIGDGSIAFIFLMILAFIVIYAGFKFLEKYVLYMVKLGHVSVVVELMRAGEVPDGKSMVSYGKDQVTNNFGTSNVAFVLDKMVYAAVRQIQRWI